MSGYVLHPEAYTDADDIWEFIAEDNLSAADRIREDIYKAVGKLLPFPYRATGAPTLPHDLYDS